MKITAERYEELWEAVASFRDSSAYNTNDVNIYELIDVMLDTLYGVDGWYIQMTEATEE